MTERLIQVQTLTQAEPPMTIGQVIGTAWRHYIAHFFQYLPLVVRGSLWLLIPITTLLVSLVWMMQRDLVFSDFSGPAALLLPAWAVLFLWCAAQALGEFAGISRLAHQTVETGSVTRNTTYKISTESIRAARRFTHARRFSLLGAAAIKNILLGAVSLAFSVIFVVAFTAAFAGSGLLAGVPNGRLFLAGGTGMIVSLGVFAWLYAWLALKLLVIEQVLAVETQVGALTAIGRSWKLMRKQLLRSLCIVFVAFLMTLPVVFAMAVLAQLGHPLLLEGAGIVLTERKAMAVGILPYITAYLVNNVFTLLGGLVVTPFFRTVLATLYFDIKNRKQMLKTARKS